MHRSLSEYIALLEREGELVRITAPVSPVEEIAEITDRVSKMPGGGKALLFENTGTEFPVLTNMFGSARRMALALGVGSLGELSERVDGLLRQAMAPRPSFADKLRALPLLAGMSRWFPRTVSGRGECQQVVRTGAEASLAALPILKCWPADGGSFVTLPMVNTVDPQTGVRNVGMYRMQLFDDRTTGMHWHIHKTGARHYEAWKRAGRRMPVSVALGGDPGPEHSSARVERYLQLAADTNMLICQPTTAAQIFHLLRRQMVGNIRKPLIVFSPKSLLRNKMASSDLEELSEGKFETVIGEIEELDADKVRRILVCTGKVYYDLVKYRKEHEIDDVVIVRLEQLYPFPHKSFREETSGYSFASEVVWVQDEPQNQGAWFYAQHHLLEEMPSGARLSYAGRPASSSPAVGYASKHAEQLKELVENAFGRLKGFIQTK